MGLRFTYTRPRASHVVSIALLLAGCDCNRAVEPAPVEPTPPQETLPSPEELCEAFGEEAGGWCVPAGAGAWWLEIESEPADCGPGGIPEEGSRGRMRLGYSAVDGGRAEEAWEPFDDCDATVTQGAQSHYDWDGDGHHELVLERTESYLDGGDRFLSLASYADGAIGGYDALPRAAGALREVRDYDGDGRPDIISHGPHELGPRESDCCSNVYDGGPSTLWHALAGGGLSREDEIARRYLREACGDPDAVWIRPVDVENARLGYIEEIQSDLMSVVTCARLRGLGPAAIRARLTRDTGAPACRDSSAPCYDDVAAMIDRLVQHASAADATVTIPTAP